MTEKFQRKIYETYKGNPDTIVKHGMYEYSIAYNATCGIHTWVVRRKLPYGDWHWRCPLDESIK